MKPEAWHAFVKAHGNVKHWLGRPGSGRLPDAIDQMEHHWVKCGMQAYDMHTCFDNLDRGILSEPAEVAAWAIVHYPHLTWLQE